MRALFISFGCLVVPIAVGCNDEVSPIADAPFLVSLTATPAAGTAPLSVRLAATCERLREQAIHTSSAEVRFAFRRTAAETAIFVDDGANTVDVVYTEPGTVVASVVGDDGAGHTATADVEIVVDAPARNTANLIVDVNHDGAVDASDDIDGEAIFLGNVDDDDGDGTRDSRDQKFDDDIDDMMIVVVEPSAGGLQGRLTIGGDVARERVRIFRGNSVVYEPDSQQSTPFAVTEERTVLHLESVSGRGAGWDGRVAITLDLVDDSGAVVSSDTVRARAAPVVISDNLDAPRELVSAFSAAGALPAAATLRVVEGSDVGDDRWIQDNMELGVQQAPLSTSAGGVQTMWMAMNTERDYGGQGLDRFVPSIWLAPSYGFYYPQGEATSHNYGGNLEVIPGLDAWPLGRLVYGGGRVALDGSSSVDTMNAVQVDFLDAQEVQGPALQVSSEWLEVGHVDEWFQVVPDLTPVASAKPFKIVIASPRLARSLTQDVQASGGGSVVFFPNRDASYTVDEILAAPVFAATNEAAQIRIDEQVERLKTELGLVDDDFREVPVFYIEGGGTSLVSAFNPGIQNLVTMQNRVFVPDPEGPQKDGVDVFQEATRQALLDTDLDVVFVDVFNSYHLLLGEAHCGTNVVRDEAVPFYAVEVSR
jgi:protein-arginine deiminase